MYTIKDLLEVMQGHVSPRINLCDIRIDTLPTVDDLNMVVSLLPSFTLYKHVCDTTYHINLTTGNLYAI